MKMRAAPKAYENPYTVSVAWVANEGQFRRATGGEEPRVKHSRQARWFFRKVAQLERTWGENLDRLGATMRQIRWVASPGARERLADVERRYRALVAFLEGRSECSSFRELRASLPSFDPVTGEELGPAGPLVPADEAQAPA